MRGPEVLEADEEEASVEATILQDKMNGTKNGASNEIKYPANCAMRLGSTPGSDGNDDDPFEPKQDRKVFRILTVIIYVFTVSFGKFFYLSLMNFTVFESRRKSLIQHCERSDLRLHIEWTKVH